MIVGLDVGYSAVKGLCGDRRCLFPAVVGTPAPEGAFSMFHNQKLLAVSDNGKFTPVGETALLQSNYATGRREPEWVLSEDWLTLLQAALSELVTVQAATVQLVNGLPVGDWRRFGMHHKERLLAQFSFRRAGRGMQTITIADVLVVTQPYGSLLDMARQHGRPKRGRRGQAGSEQLATRPRRARGRHRVQLGEEPAHLAGRGRTLHHRREDEIGPYGEAGGSAYARRSLPNA